MAELQTSKMKLPPGPIPKSLLMYLVRMGSFTSAPKLANEDSADADIDLPDNTELDTLLERCDHELVNLPPMIHRNFHHVVRSPTEDDNPEKIRLMQWNVLAQALGEKNDNFILCPHEALDWRTRRWRMLQEMLTYRPDVVCLQEVDHYNFLNKTLGSVGYRSTFFPKPDSPCCYTKDNNGPDGCAIFYNASKFELVVSNTRVLEVWVGQSNQVAVLCVFRRKFDGREFCVATTHLKARQGAILSALRNQQGKDLLEYLRQHYGRRPLVVAGDFNAEPSEPVYRTFLDSTEPRLESCYRLLSNRHEEPQYTTWKVREEGEVCHTIDYIFYTKDDIRVESLLCLPSEEDIGVGRVPSLRYSSDHFSLICDFRLPEM